MRFSKRMGAIVVCLLLFVSSMLMFYACGGEQDENVTVTFETDSNTVIEPITVKANTNIEAPDNPIKEGHIFKGWYLDLNKTDDGPFDFEATPISKSITLYAMWQVRTFNVNFLSPDGEALEGFPSGVYAWGSLLTEPDISSIEKPGYKIKWFKQNGEVWDFASSKVVSRTDLTYRYVTTKDTYDVADIAENFYPVLDKIKTGQDENGEYFCHMIYTEGADTVSYVYKTTNLQQIVVNIELLTLEYESATIVARPADNTGLYKSDGSFSQWRAYILTDKGGNVSYNDEPSSGYPPAYYYIQSTGTNKDLFSTEKLEEGWVAYTFNLAALKFWDEGTTLYSFAFGFVSQSLGIEVQSIKFNKVDKEKMLNVSFVDSLGNEISEISSQSVKWNTKATEPKKLADTENRKYTGNWLDPKGNVFDFDTPVRKDITLTPEYLIQGIYSWKGEELVRDFRAVYNLSKENVSGKVFNNQRAIFTFANGASGNSLEQIAVENLDLPISDYRYLTVKIRTLNYSDFSFNPIDALGRVRIYLETDLGGNLYNKDVSDAKSFYYELKDINYYAVTSPINVSSRMEDGWFVVTVDLFATQTVDGNEVPVFAYYKNGTTLKGFAFGTTTEVKALEVEEITLSKSIEIHEYVTVSFTAEDGTPIEAIEMQTVPFGKQALEPPISLIPEKEEYEFDRWLDENGNPFNFSYAITENIVLKASYRLSSWTGTTVKYSGQDIVDNFTASRERYGNTIGTSPNIQYDLSLNDDGDAYFEYTSAMKPTNKAITGLNLGINIHEGSKLVIKFTSDNLTAGTYGFTQFKLGLAFRGEDPATTIKNSASNAHYFGYTGITAGTERGSNNQVGISFSIDENGLITVEFDLYAMYQASIANLAPDADGLYVEAFTFLAVEAQNGKTTAVENSDTFVFKEITFVDVRQSILEV